MKRLTSHRINTAIKEVTGVDAKVFLEPNVSAHFYSDDERTSEILSRTDTGVMVARYSHLTLEQWVDSFKLIWNNAQNVLKGESE